MPHATVAQDAQDDLLIQQALDPENSFDFTRDLEPGEKADDAVNFSDLSDDDLADDEDGADSEAVHNSVVSGSRGVDASLDDLEYTSHNESLSDQKFEASIHGEVEDDLFGERSSSPIEDRNAAEDSGRLRRPTGTITSLGSSDRSASKNELDVRSLIPEATKDLEGYDMARQAPLSVVSVGARDGILSKEQQLQQELFAMSGAAYGKMDTVPIIETQDDLLAALWPRFECDTVPKFMDLLPPKKARYIGKTHSRRPKPVQPTKLNLEIAGDQEKTFRFALTSNRKSQANTGRNGIVTIQEGRAEGGREEDSEDVDSDFEHQMVGGVSWQDLQLICGDWDTQTSTDVSSPGLSGLDLADKDDIFVDLVGHFEDQLELPPAKASSARPMEEQLLIIDRGGN